MTLHVLTRSISVLQNSYSEQAERCSSEIWVDLCSMASSVWLTVVQPMSEHAQVPLTSWVPGFPGWHRSSARFWKRELRKAADGGMAASGSAMADVSSEVMRYGHDCSVCVCKYLWQTVRRELLGELDGKLPQRAFLEGSCRWHGTVRLRAGWCKVAHDGT